MRQIVYTRGWVETSDKIDLNETASEFVSSMSLCRLFWIPVFVTKYFPLAASISFGNMLGDIGKVEKFTVDPLFR